MISYRHADILRQLKTQNTPIEITCEVFGMAMKDTNGTPAGMRFYVRFTDINCEDKEIKSLFTQIFYPIVEDYDYEKKGSYILNYRFQSMDGALNNYMAIINELKSNTRVKSVKNVMESMESTFKKTMKMTVILRG